MEMGYAVIFLLMALWLAFQNRRLTRLERKVLDLQLEVYGGEREEVF